MHQNSNGSNMNEDEKKFHEELGKLVFEASTKLSVQKIIIELEMLKVLIEFHHISNMKDVVKAREAFEKMYG